MMLRGVWLGMTTRHRSSEIPSMAKPTDDCRSMVKHPLHYIPKEHIFVLALVAADPRVSVRTDC